MSNTSNSSMSNTTSGSRGNVSQSGNRSMSPSSQRGHSNQPPSSSSSSSQHQNPNFDSNVISERVKNLATQIYQELKRIISRCNYDEDILSGLMPLIVRVLESLDLALIENQQLQVELELCKDDNEQLVVMFEKEKAAKRAIDKKLIELEYANDEERQQYQQKIESLDNVVKMYELKAKNASDQASRFEEKEAERTREYNKLHDRYTELLKSHCDVVERVRHLVGNAEAANISGSINVPQQVLPSSSDLHSISDQVRAKITKHEDIDLADNVAALKSRATLKSWSADTELTLEDASLMVIEDMLEPHNKTGDSSSHHESDRGTSEPEGEQEKESENDSIAYTSMEKEFRKLIQENKDLLNTKNALNVVKDDLIAEVDRLTNEVSMYEQAVEQLNLTKDQMKHKVSALDAELRKTKEDLEKAKQKIRENNEEGVPYSQRKRFGRAEMAKVLMERNNYKERFMELQDAVRYTELVRNKIETEKRSGLWKFFSNLFGAPPINAIGPGGSVAISSSRNTSPVVSYQGSVLGAMVTNDPQVATSANQTLASDVLQTSVARSGSNSAGLNGAGTYKSRKLSSNSDLIVLMDSDLNIDRGRAFRDGNPKNLDASGYIHAYGWSLPASSVKSLMGNNSKNESNLIGSSLNPDDVVSASNADGNFNSSKLSGLQVPIPQYCRPLIDDSLGMKIWCATAINLSGGDLPAEKKEQGLETSNTNKSLSSTQTNLSFQDASIQEGESSSSVVNISTSTPKKSTDHHALKILEQEVKRALDDDETSPSDFLGNTISSSQATTRKSILKTTTEMVLNAVPFSDDSEDLSSYVWICSTQHSRSKITVIDIKNKPNELLDSFYVPTFVYCIKSFPGCKSIDLLGIKSVKSGIDLAQETSNTLGMINELIATQRDQFYRLVEIDPVVEEQLRQDHIAVSRSSGEDKQNDSSCTDKSLGQVTSDTSSRRNLSDDDLEISRILDNNITSGIATLQKLNEFVAHTQPELVVEESPQADISTANLAEDIINDANKSKQRDAVYYQPISTHLPTVWMGGRDCILYVHSAFGQWKDCVAYVKMRDSILQMCHYRGRAFVALADGTLCVFFRNVDTKQWDFSKYLVIDINLMAEITKDAVDLTESHPVDLQTRLSTASSASEDPGTSKSGQKSNIEAKPVPRKPSKVAGIRCLEITNKNLWVGYQNRVFIFDPITLKLKHTFKVVPQIDNQIRQIIAMKDGVFCCLRSDLVLRLYSSLRPYQHIENIDIEPVVTRLISPKTFVISHITAMKVADNTLWIGNAHGIIITIPCKLVPQISEAPIINRDGQTEEVTSNLSIARFVPKCDITNARISFHGHRDAVKFFTLSSKLMLSGGQGYLDFRFDMDDQSKSISDKSHLILWQLTA